MAVEANAGGVTLTGDAIDFFYKGAALRGLAVEIVTGMKLSRNGSGLDACKVHGLLPEGRTTRKAGLRAAVKEMQRQYPKWEIPRSVKRALDAK